MRFDVLQALLVETLQLALEVRLHFGQVLDSGGGHFDQFLHGEIQIVWFEIRICPFRPLGATQSGGPFQETNEIPRTCIDAMEKKTNKKEPSCSLKHGDVQWRQLKSQSLPTLTVEMEPPRRRFKSSHRKAENQNRKGPTRPTDGARPIGHCENDVSAIKKKTKVKKKNPRRTGTKSAARNENGSERNEHKKKQKTKKKRKRTGRKWRVKGTTTRTVVERLTSERERRSRFFRFPLAIIVPRFFFPCGSSIGGRRGRIQ